MASFPFTSVFTMSIALGILFFLLCRSEAEVVAKAKGVNPVLQLKAGELRGKVEPVLGGQDVEEFLGIPYAKPPVGELRFAAPLPASPWDGVRDATKYDAKCPRGGIIPPSKAVSVNEIISEDCLFLNVFRPANRKASQTLPVMFWIHGGGFHRGSGMLYDGSPLASYNDVIVVTINYRLGLLGFLNIPGTELKGNYGMLDQVLALKWVQENIDSFGGNPARVTIFGESAGGASVGLHVLSPLSKGLFHNVILQSGDATSTYGSFTTKDEKKNDVFLQRLNCIDKKKLLSCLRSKTTDIVIRAQGSCDFLLLGTNFTVPTVDGEFLRDEPKVLLAEGRVNTFGSAMIGVNKDEGAFFPHGIQPSGKDIPPSLEAFYKIIKDVSFTQNGESDLVKKAILFQYTNHTDPSNPQNILQNWQNLVSDSWFFGPAVFTATSFAKAGVPTFFYHMSYRSTYSTYPLSAGVNHFDEIQYVFGMPWKWNPVFRSATAYTDVERGLSSFIMKLWTNFAKYGNPNRHQDGHDLVNWPRYTTEKQEYLDMNLVPRVRSKLYADRVAFWNEFVPKLKEICQRMGKEKVRSSEGRIEL